VGIVVMKKVQVRLVKLQTCREIEKGIMPEANLLFQYPNLEPQNWYIERQIEKNIERIIDVLSSSTISKSHRYSISLFDDLMNWLLKNNPMAY
jgi:hypothetical protein